MRTSLKRTTLAVLRSIIGVKDNEMAEILQCSCPTIHSVESGRLKLSDDLARRVSHETGISLSWLLNGDVKAPPISANHRPFTRELYESHRATKTLPAGMEFSPVEMASFYGQLRAILVSADCRSDYQIAAYKVEKMITALAAEFGRDESVYSGDAHTHDLRRSSKLMEADAKSVKAFARGLADAWVKLTPAQRTLIAN
jgi:hypothetical protein